MSRFFIFSRFRQAQFECRLEKTPTKPDKESSWTMNTDLLAALDFFERDRGLDREVIARVIEEALEAAAVKVVGPNQLSVKLDPKTGDITAVAKVTAVRRVEHPETEISLSEARRQKAKAKLGDEIDLPVPPREFGRIVAQTTRQGIFQRLRQVEKDILRNEYKDRVGEMFHGVVNRFEKGDVLIDFDGHEGLLRHEERIPTEDYQIGDHISCVLIEVNMDKPGPVLLVSRAHDSLLQRLFEREVTEIAEGIVTIKAVAREPGFRSKIAVDSSAARVDPVGACVGIRGSRVKTIVRELSGEKVDIIRWNPDLAPFVTNALQPAELKSLQIDEKNKQVNVQVHPDQLSLAIGRRGQNVRLTARLTGWKIEINKAEEEERATLEEKMKEAATTLATGLGITEDIAQKLVDNGFLSLDGIKAADDADLMAIEGLDADVVKTIREAAGNEPADS